MLLGKLLQPFDLVFLRRLVQQCDHLPYHLLLFGPQLGFGLNMLVHLQQADGRVIPEKDTAGGLDR